MPQQYDDQIRELEREIQRLKALSAAEYERQRSADNSRNLYQNDEPIQGLERRSPVYDLQGDLRRTLAAPLWSITQSLGLNESPTPQESGIDGLPGFLERLEELRGLGQGPPDAFPDPDLDSPGIVPGGGIESVYRAEEREAEEIRRKLEAQGRLRRPGLRGFAQRESNR